MSEEMDVEDASRELIKLYDDKIKKLMQYNYEMNGCFHRFSKAAVTNGTHGDLYIFREEIRKRLSFSKALVDEINSIPPDLLKIAASSLPLGPFSYLLTDPDALRLNLYERLTDEAHRIYQNRTRAAAVQDVIDSKGIPSFCTFKNLRETETSINARFAILKAKIFNINKHFYLKMIQKRIDAVLTVHFDSNSSVLEAVIRSAQEDSFLQLNDCATKSQYSIFQLMSIDMMSKILGLLQKGYTMDNLMIMCSELWSNSKYCETFISSQKGNIVFEIPDNFDS